EIAPMMRAISAEDIVEARLGEGQFLRHALLRRNIAETALARRLSDNSEHIAGEVVCDDFAHLLRHREADMAAAAAEIEHTCFALSGHLRRKRFEIGTLRMDGARQIGA